MELMRSNDKLNYYKFGLGLGAVSAASPSSSGKKGEAEASEAAAGGADQCVIALELDVAVQTVTDAGHRLITTDLARFCDALAAL